MILLLSAHWDIHVDFVINWLEEYSQPYIRINIEDLITEDVYIDLKEEFICIGEKRIEKACIHAIWFRKFGFNDSKKKMEKELGKRISSDALNSIFNEYTSLMNAIKYLFRDAYWITKPWAANINKIHMIQKAKSFNINVPSTWIVSSKKQVEILIEEGKKMVFKSISDSHALFTNKGYYSMFTKEITHEIIDLLPLKFMPSLVQEKILKEYEVRIFYLEGSFYSMCMFSQENKETEIDFRKSYVSGNIIRRVPYELPNDISIKLKHLLENIDINCCSIDMVRSSFDNNLYFLEINPTGAFGMVNTPCNYELYRLIAKRLIDRNYEEVLY